MMASEPKDFLADALDLAFTAHAGQRDKAGDPYILHVLRVMFKMRRDGDRVVALLHDLVEDTECTLCELRVRNLPEHVVDAVDALTRRKGSESYAEYIERVAENPIARRVKLADLEDNLTPSRIAMLPPAEAASLSKRYFAAYRRLSDAG